MKLGDLQTIGIGAGSGPLGFAPAIVRAWARAAGADDGVPGITNTDHGRD